MECSAFSTFRVHKPSIYFEGNKVDVLLQDKEGNYEIKEKHYLHKGIAVIKTVYTAPISKLSENIALLDSGYSKAEFLSIIRKMYHNYIEANGENALFDFVVLQYSEKNTLIQTYSPIMTNVAEATCEVIIKLHKTLNYLMR
ncbi:MAG: hypothetical protein EP326_10120 [Deltaproteobacteria bacterium]|nr:MAG: hypothetical protein EP326_10120 [Deltaproteobacteria bacterium]